VSRLISGNTDLAVKTRGEALLCFSLLSTGKPKEDNEVGRHVENKINSGCCYRRVIPLLLLSTLSLDNWWTLRDVLFTLLLNNYEPKKRQLHAH
jgi:hypothetical protein